MNSQEWNDRGYTKFKNPSGEIIRTKTYKRFMVTFDNMSAQQIVSERKKLADILQVPYADLLADLEITIDIKRHPQRHKRFNEYFRA